MLLSGHQRQILNRGKEEQEESGQGSVFIFAVEYVTSANVATRFNRIRTVLPFTLLFSLRN